MYKTLAKFIARGPARSVFNNSGDKSPDERKPTKKIRSFFKSGKSVSGKILAVNKGGYNIAIRTPSNYDYAFCPYSEMPPEINELSNTDDIKKQEMQFKIIELKMRSVVLSRKKMQNTPTKDVPKLNPIELAFKKALNRKA